MLNSSRRALINFSKYYASNSITANKFAITPSLASTNLHTAPTLNHKSWRAWKDETDKDPDWFLKHNDKKYPPLGVDEKPRPAFICHDRKHIKYSPKKLWYIAGFIRGLSIEDAINQLKFVHKKGAVDVLEVLLEAQQLAVEKHNVEFPTNLWVAESFCYQDYTMKSVRRHAKGRAGNITHRYSRYCVTLEEGSPPTHYYHYKKPKTPTEHISSWLEQLRERTVVDNI